MNSIARASPELWWNGSWNRLLKSTRWPKIETTSSSFMAPPRLGAFPSSCTSSRPKRRDSKSAKFFSAFCWPSTSVRAGPSWTPATSGAPGRWKWPGRSWGLELLTCQSRPKSTASSWSKFVTRRPSATLRWPPNACWPPSRRLIIISTLEWVPNQKDLHLRKPNLFTEIMTEAIKWPIFNRILVLSVFYSC